MRRFLQRSQLLFFTAALLVFTLAVSFRREDKYFEISKNLDIFSAFYRELNTYYVDDLSAQQLMYKGINAMLDETDPYTDFIPEENLDELKFMATGKYGGVGASINTDSNKTVISDVYEGSPMYKAGVKPGDIILSLDGHNTLGLKQDDVSKLLKGASGTTLAMRTKNPISGEEHDRKIVREEINVKPVAFAGMTREDVGYIKMSQFTENGGNQVQDAFEKLKAAHPGMKGLILDLRGNPGGLLEEAVAVSNIFIDKNRLIVRTKGRIKNWDHDYKTERQAIDLTLPLVVLTNHSSASASEIVAGAIQDLDRGVIIGQRSFGKGLVQTTRTLPYNTKLKVTTAKYYTPSGRCIQAIDYSHRNEDGEADYVPDSLRKNFTTQRGRAVRDGGGIEPDDKVEPIFLSQVAVTLLRRQYIFDYATIYYYAHPQQPQPATFSLTDAEFDNFVQFLDGKDYSYKTRSEEALETFASTARKEKYFDAVSAEYQSLQQKMKHDKKQDLLKNKTEIRHLLEEEIVSRYYLQRGRIEKGLAWDNDVKEAVAVLHNPAQYTALLKGK
ncbi:C-terminal processing peptidase-3. Serine peptidase. MEROPS family S41A [Chitinophaga costaii]|uniref:C-terminal processing peptidase-3. Serine peptidase. MEROPS family S41A n=1 Tax=Chitinophaga costaii TaxID=1335309 RepID=A0A1C4F6P3_9BACT|nr:S41 family peptidase [Chitinophaga costaii]PUZ21260.1 S41 family peptidase [Chitinophaga costaii]SCC51303.1 C-terminal processing peptidase-3. Serine peptidase. MEROPS family S41A [Chitinophaga costaii]